MIKNLVFAAALLSLALAGGCATGGNGKIPPPVTVTVATPSGIVASEIYPTQSVTLTATVTNSTETAVTWSLSGPGTLTPVTPATTPAKAIYVAPATATSAPVVTATLASDTSITGTLPITVVDITTVVSPASPSVGTGLTQQFTAVAVPVDAPQTFTWTCTAAGVQCATFSSNGSGLATYTANDSCSGSCVQISAAAPLDPMGCINNPASCTIGKVSLVTSRLAVNSTYAFQFSGYDSSQHPVMVAGNFTTGKTANTVASGFADELTSNGPAQNTITGGSYTPTASDPNNSNNAGVLTLSFLSQGVYPNQFQVVLDAAGDLEMIESDGQGTGSGIAQKSNATAFSGTTDQTYAFGFTGVDAGGNRIGYAGVLPLNGTGTITGGQIDVNDNGVANSYSNVTGGYQADSNINGLWHVTNLALTSGVTLDFDFFVSSGSTSKTDPLTFYAISTDGPAHPAVSGTMVLQDSSQTYNNAAFKGISVSALTGTGTATNGTIVPGTTNVSLTLGTTDGTSGGTGGTGGFSGNFDQNNNGTIVTVPPGSPFAYTYAASGTNGRYIFNMLGNPAASPVVSPLPFVLYASGQNRGFLLDQSSSSVMTGTMNPQGKFPTMQGVGGFDGSELPSTFAAATTGSGSFAVTPIAANLLLTFNGASGGVEMPGSVAGTEYFSSLSSPGPQAVAGTYTMSGSGRGTIASIAPATTPNYVIYTLDTSGCSGQAPVCTIQNFLMIDTDKTNTNASVIFAQQ